METPENPVFEMRGPIKKPVILLAHILAGRSILTVRSHRTHDRLTLSFRRPSQWKKRRPVWVSLLGGSEEHRSWSFLGTLWEDSGEPESLWYYKRSDKSPIFLDAPEHKVVQWIAKHCPQHIEGLMEQADWWHEGRCGRCGRRLTVPESIETGFGPECFKLIG